MQNLWRGENSNEYDFFNFWSGRGIFCTIGDILFDLKGRGNKKLGTSKNIDSNWMHMAYWRFGASILVAFIGDVLLGFGFLSLVNQVQPEEQRHTDLIFPHIAVYKALLRNHSDIAMQIMEEGEAITAKKVQKLFKKW